MRSLPFHSQYLAEKSVFFFCQPEKVFIGHRQELFPARRGEQICLAYALQDSSDGREEGRLLPLLCCYHDVVNQCVDRDWRVDIHNDVCDSLADSDAPSGSRGEGAESEVLPVLCPENEVVADVCGHGDGVVESFEVNLNHVTRVAQRLSATEPRRVRNLRNLVLRDNTVQVRLGYQAPATLQLWHTERVDPVNVCWNGGSIDFLSLHGSNLPISTALRISSSLSPVGLIVREVWRLSN
eukprot:gene8517-biopygen5888